MGTCRCGAAWTGSKIEHCSAAGCHQSFSCTRAGDMHRVGDHAVTTGPDRRRCLSVEEMTARGMAQNSHGAWMTPSSEVREHLRERRDIAS